MKDPSTRHSHCIKRAPNSFHDQGLLQTADSFPAFEASPETVWLLRLFHLPVGRNACPCMTCG